MKNELKNKSMHSISFSKTEFNDTRSWDWLKCGDLERAAENTLMAAQEQAIRTPHRQREHLPTPTMWRTRDEYILGISV